MNLFRMMPRGPADSSPEAAQVWMDHAQNLRRTLFRERDGVR